jgi:hypothetical protein
MGGATGALVLGIDLIVSNDTLHESYEVMISSCLATKKKLKSFYTFFHLNQCLRVSSLNIIFKTCSRRSPQLVQARAIVRDHVISIDIAPVLSTFVVRRKFGYPSGTLASA